MKLQDCKNKQPFSVSEGYFQELSRKIVESTSKTPVANSAKKRIAIGLWARVLGNVAMLAIVVLIAIQAIMWNTPGTHPQTASTQQEEEPILDNEMIDNILSSYPIDDYTFYCCLTGNEIN